MGKGKNTPITPITLENFVNLQSDKAILNSSSPSPFQLYRWDDHPHVLLLLWPSMARQTLALARLSFYLEDAELHDQVISSFPTGRRGGALSYSGHNARTLDIAAFLNAAAQQGRHLWPEEWVVMERLESIGAIRHERDYNDMGWVTTVAPESTTSSPSLPTPLQQPRQQQAPVKSSSRTAPSTSIDQPLPPTPPPPPYPGTWHGSSFSLISLCAGSNVREARDTLLHECMHGLFYSHVDFQRAVESYWHDSLSHEHREQFRDFLRDTNYNANNEYLCINEFQAYMSTERTLFATGGGGKGGGDKGWAGLGLLQGPFCRAMRDKIPSPPPRLASTKCLFDG